MEDGSSDLLHAATSFADSLTRTVHAVIGPHVDRFVGRAVERSGLVSVRQEPRAGIELCIKGEKALLLAANYWCAWDHKGDYLAVSKSDFKIRALSAPSEPLFRVEYIRSPTGTAPVAHIQVHADRTEWVDALTGCGSASSRARRRAALVANGTAEPKLAQVHFPIGGHRFRPCLEDILEMLLDEFGVDRQQGAREALADGREGWRRAQLAAAVRDSPEEAARVLRECGYTVHAPESGPPPDRVDRLRQY